MSTPMSCEVEDEAKLKDIVRLAAIALAREGFDRRIDIYRTVEVADPWILETLGRKHRIRVRVKITAESLLFEREGDR